MRNQDMAIFSQKLSAVGELHGKEISRTLLELYWAALSGFKLKEVVEAIDACVASPDGGQFFPKPADVIRWIRGDGEYNALEAWRRVDKAVRLIGAYDCVVFDDPLIHVVIESLGGWVKLCRCSDYEYQFRMRDFIRAYLAYKKNGLSVDVPSLHGLCWKGNARAGYDLPKPTYFGDKDKCKAVEKMMQRDEHLSLVDLTAAANSHVKKLEA